MNDASLSEAMKDLQTIRQMMQRTRRAVGQAGAGQFTVLWGLVWLVGFAGSQFLPESAVGWLWLAVDTLGAVGSLILGARLGRRVQTWPGWRIGLWWLALLAYGVLLIWLLGVESSQQLALALTLLVCLGYVLTGVILSRHIAAMGLILTGLALGGYFGLPDYFFLWMALVGGGTLIGTGLWIMRRWG